MIKTVAWIAIFIVGMFILAPIAAIAGSPWGVIALSWLGFWVIVGVLAQLNDPSWH